jgi:biopolymer transport protein ExbD
MLLKKRKKKHALPIVEINVVSLMDIITTLLFFLILIISFTNYSIIKGSALSLGKMTEEKPKPTFSLRITVKNRKSARILIGPTKDLTVVNKNSLNSYLSSYFSGSPTKGFTKIVASSNEDAFQQRIQRILIRLKRGFPHETKAILAFADPVHYQRTIDLI